jgi:hypothetical protein
MEVMVGRRPRSRLFLGGGAALEQVLWVNVRPDTATVPIEMFGPRPPGQRARLTILGEEDPGAVQRQDPLVSLLDPDELQQRRHVPAYVQAPEVQAHTIAVSACRPDLRCAS